MSKILIERESEAVKLLREMQANAWNLGPWKIKIDAVLSGAQSVPEQEMKLTSRYEVDLDVVKRQQMETAEKPVGCRHCGGPANRICGGDCIPKPVPETVLSEHDIAIHLGVDKLWA